MRQLTVTAETLETAAGITNPRRNAGGREDSQSRTWNVKRFSVQAHFWSTGSVHPSSSDLRRRGATLAPQKYEHAFVRCWIDGIRGLAASHQVRAHHPPSGAFDQ